MKHSHRPFALLTLLCAACTIAPSLDDHTGSAEQEERWSSADDPRHFASDLEWGLARLPERGQASPIPWPGSFWPALRDSINYPWAGAYSMSAARKYAAAFGGDVENLVSRFFGIDSQRYSGYCIDDSQCNGWRHEFCGIRSFEPVGRCVPFWFGICGGWASASILFPEPRHAVTVNGVVFRVQDIKALLSLLQTSGAARVVSLKCEAADDLGQVLYDVYGRPVAPQCRDTNPGTFHVLLGNYLGLRGKSFVEDRTFDVQVWNQPIRGYQVLEQRDVSAADANTLVAHSAASTYIFDRDARRFAYVKTQVAYIKEAASETDGNLAASIDHYTGYDVYEYVLELDGAGSIIGGEWVGASKRAHPDFLWIPVAPGSAVAGGAIRYDHLSSLISASTRR